MELHFSCNGPSSPTPEGMVDGGVGVYLHGQAESECGFDIPDTNIDLNGLGDGIHAAHLNGEPGYTLFLWRSHRAMLRGLVVKDSDVEALEFARVRYEAQSNFL